MSKKIEKLTPEQEAMFPVYRDKWIKIGTDTARLDFATTEKTVNAFRKLIGMEEAPLIIAENPIEAWVVCALSEQGVAFDDLKTEMATVFNGNPKKYEIPKASLPYQTGSLFASVFSFYDYMLEEVGVEIDKDLYAKYKTWEQTAQIGCIYPLDNLTVVCEKPSEVHLNENNVLHRDGGPALSYTGLGDFKVYALNGVRVPEWLAVTPDRDLDINRYNEIDNADVKAEFVRKVGIERFLSKGKLIDTYDAYDKKKHEWWYKSEYELWDMSNMFDGLDYAPYLKMQNQSTQVWHMEAVSPECRTIEAAIKERFGGRDFIIKAIA